MSFTPHSSQEILHPSRHRLICYLQPLINNRKRLAQLILSDAQRWIGKEGVPTHEGVEPLLAEVSAERLHLWRSAVERRHRLERLAIADQLEDAEQAKVARRAYRRVARFQILHQLAHQVAHLARALDQVVFLVDRDRRQRRRTSQRMTVVG